MIRATIPDDMAAIASIAEAIGFQPRELEELSAMLVTYLNGNHSSDEFWLTDDDDGEPVGVAYCAPERMTEGTWNLLFIAIRPDRQGQGRGAALIRYVEQTLMDQGARLLLVETLASFEDAR
ncbi:MAG: GNAT family N-acetyltransferase, partial [Cyanobacteria bacterium P01_H01_bin.58]